MFELIKLVVITGVPAWLIYSRKHTAALSWLAVTIPLDALSASFIIKVTCLSGFGIVALPFVAHELKNRIRSLTKAESLIILSAAMMVVGMVVFGFLFPWPDPTGKRGINQAAPGRSVIFTARYIFDFASAMYVSFVIHRRGRPGRMMNYLLIGTTVVAVAVFLQLATGIDLFYHLNAHDERNLADLGRARGISYEPRTAAQWGVVGVLLCVVVSNLGWVRWPLMLLHLGAMAATFSTSGLTLLLVSLVVAALYVKRARRAALALAAALVLFACVAASSPAVSRYVGTFGYMLGQRWLLAGREPVDDAGWFERARNHLEVFEYAAVGFLADNPQYLAFGTGPGVISIPATQYATAAELRLYDGRLDTAPRMGLVLIPSNLGLVGLYVWFLLVHRCRHSIYRVYKTVRAVEWRDNFVLFNVFTVYYLLICREMWFLSLGVGLGAALMLRSAKQARTEVSGA